MNIVRSSTPGPLPLGKQGERGVTQVHFDLRPFLLKFGEGTVQLTVKRPRESAEYAAQVRRSGETAIWEIGGEWTEKSGAGECQLSWYMGDALAKSVTYRTQVLPGMGAGEQPPEPQEGYLDQVQRAGAQAAQSAQTAQASAAASQAAADRAEQAVVHAPTVGANGNWYVWDSAAGAYVDTGERAQGEPGRNIYVNVKDYGAAGDGVTDDTQAIQAAFDSVPAGGGTVYFPPGTYIVKHSDTLTGEDRIAVHVKGINNLTVYFDNSAKIKQNLTTVNRYALFRFSGIDGLEIKGGVIEADRDEHPDVSSGYGSKGIHILDCNNVHVHDMEIRNIFGDCLGVQGGSQQCENVLIENCHFHDCYRNGITVGGVKNGTVRNCHIYNVSGGNPQAGIDVEAEYGYDNEDIAIESCNIHSCGQFSIVHSSNSYNLTVSNCRLGTGMTQPTGDNMSVVNTVGTSINLRLNATVRGCRFKEAGLYNEAVNVTFEDTVFTGSEVTGSPTINFNNASGGKAVFKNCTLHHRADATHALFYSYGARVGELTLEGCRLHLHENGYDTIFYGGERWGVIRLLGCTITAEDTALTKRVLRVDAGSRFELLDCMIDLTKVTSYSQAVVAALGPTLPVFLAANNSILTAELDTPLCANVFGLTNFTGTAYLINNIAPTLEGLNSTPTGDGTIFARNNVVSGTPDFSVLSAAEEASF